MAKLYPPYIEGTIPAFYIDYDPTGKVKKGAVLTVPFSMNPSVSETQVAGFVLRLKTVQTGAYVFPPKYTTNFDLSINEIVFNLTAAEAKLLNEGQYYKLQIAYCGEITTDNTGAISSDNIGYFSTVGVIKCTSKPEVSINGLFADSVNLFTNAYTGIYDCTNCIDKTERVYSYRFDIYDEDNNLFWTSTELLHSSAEDGEYDISMDRTAVREFSTNGENYTIQYTVTTLNGLVLSTPKYRLTNDSFMTPSKDIEIIASSNYDKGYVSITFKAEPDLLRDGEESACYGEYLLSRSSEDDDYSIWVEINRFRLDDEKPSTVEIIDFTVEQGKKYKYSLQQYNIWDLYASRITTDIIEAGFEDAYLYDGQKYLRIRYNPKIATFKTDILEVKQDTIGGKYPFILRNGETAYKEFPIEGLIAAELDEEQLFIDQGLLSWKRNFTAASSEYSKILLNPPVPPKDKNAPPPPSFPETEDLTERQQEVWDNYHLAQDEYLASGLYQEYLNSEAYLDYSNKLAEYNSLRDQMTVAELAAQEALAERDRTILGLRNIHTEDELYNKGLFRNTHDLTDENLAVERKFKLAILDWLNDGKPKLFKSPTEGNYIVRLINTSLVPEAALGRMIHNFKTTAFEIAEVTYDNLVKYGFLHIDEPSDFVGLWKSYDLEHAYKAGAPNGKTIIKIPFESNLISFVAQDLYPGDIIKIKYYDQGDYVPIQIGVTGSYYFNSLGRIVTDLYIEREDGLKQMGTIHCYYKGTRITKFDAIKNIMLKTIPSLQFIGVNPYLLQTKNKNWASKNNQDQYENVIYPDEYRALEQTTFRDTLNHHTFRASSTSAYTYDETFINEMDKFIPGDIIQITNSTIYNHIDEATGNTVWDDKVKLLNLEQITLRLRPVIPVYLLHSDMSAWEKYLDADSRWYKYKLIEPVSVTPFGKPWPIEELKEKEMLDPFCIYKVYVYYQNDDEVEWSPLDDALRTHNSCYYDAHYNVWLDDYDPTFYINDEYYYDGIKFNPEENYEYDEENNIYINRTTGLENSYLSEDFGIYLKDDNYYYISDGQEVEFNICDANHVLFVKVDSKYIPLSIRGLDSSNNVIQILNPESPIAHTDNNTPIPGLTYYTQVPNEIDLSITEQYYFNNLGIIDKLRIGSGVMAEATIQLKVIDYYTEFTDENVARAKQEYIDSSQFVQGLAETEEILTEADIGQSNGEALRDLYNILINGNKTLALSQDHKDIINTILASPNDKADLNLVGIYKIYSINTKLGNSNGSIIREYWTKDSDLSESEKLEYLLNAKLYKYFYDPQANFNYKIILLNDADLESLKQSSIDEYNLKIDEDATLTSQQKEIVKAAYEEYMYLDDTFQIINTNYSLLDISYQIYTEQQLEELIIDDYYLTQELQDNEKIEEKEINIVVDNVEELTGVLNKRNAIDDGQGNGVIYTISDQIGEIEQSIIENKKEFDDNITALKTTVANYNNQIYAKMAFEEILRLLNEGEDLKKIEFYYTDASEEITEVIEETQVNIEDYVNLYRASYQQVQKSLDNIKTYLKIQDDRNDDIELDDYLTKFIEEQNRNIFINMYKMYETQQIIADDTLLNGQLFNVFNSYYNDFDKDIIYDIKDYLIPYSEAGLSYYLNTCLENLTQQLEKMDYKKISLGTVDFDDILDCILFYDEAKLYLDALQIGGQNEYVVSENLVNELSTAKDKIDDYMSILSAADIKIINAKKDLLATKYQLTAQDNPGEESSTAVVPDPAAYWVFKYNPLNDKALDPTLDTDEQSNAKYLNTLPMSEQIDIQQKSLMYISNILNYVTSIQSMVANGTITSNDTNTIISYINNSILSDTDPENPGTYSNLSIENGYIVPMREAIYNVNSLTDDYLMELKKLTVFNELINGYNEKYNYLYNGLNELTYHFVYPNPSTYEIFNLDENVLKFIGSNNYQDGLFFWYVQYILENGLDELEKLLSQARLLLTIYNALLDNYNTKYYKYDKEYSDYKAIYDAYNGTIEQGFYEGTNEHPIQYYRDLTREKWIAFVNALDIAYTAESERGLYIV